MKLINADRQQATVSLTYNEIYTLLQCVIEACRLDESEKVVVLNATPTQLDALADALNDTKTIMRAP